MNTTQPTTRCRMRPRVPAAGRTRRQLRALNLSRNLLLTGRGKQLFRKRFGNRVKLD